MARRPDVVAGVDHDRSGLRCAELGTTARPRACVAVPTAPRGVPPQRSCDNGRMIRSELIGRIAQQQPLLAKRDVELAVKTILKQMAACLAGGGRIETRDFASFSLHFHDARIARNPATGSPVSVPARHVVHFKPGKKLRERLNREPREPPGAQRGAPRAVRA